MLNAIRVMLAGLMLAAVIIVVGYWIVMGSPPADPPLEISVSAGQAEPDSPCVIEPARDVLIRLATTITSIPEEPSYPDECEGSLPEIGDRARDWIPVLAVRARRPGTKPSSAG